MNAQKTALTMKNCDDDDDVKDMTTMTMMTAVIVIIVNITFELNEAYHIHT